MRFSSTQEVRAWADRAARNDFTMYLSERADFNPYCTPGARSCWERGFVGAPPYNYEGTLEGDWQYQRGAAAQRIIQELLCT